MDIIKLGTQLLAQKLATSDTTAIEKVLFSLMGSSDNKSLDLSKILEQVNLAGLASLAQSWLGDGDNEAVSSSQIESIFGADKLMEAAASLNVSTPDLISGLQDMLPTLLDKSSAGGNLLDSVGGIGGLANLAGKLFR